ncbi:MAG: hypothetical protein JWO47_586 [Candidatus Saccharibacteria bacterium]|nr:hypothetical protein [Candidatus Saccharibacteria bacterium]
MEENVKKNFWLYTLALSDGKYYVGITAQRNPYVRINQHGKFASAAWTHKHKPLKEPLIELKKLGYMTYVDAKKLESETMMEYVKKYGQNNVRGGNVNFTEDSIKIGNRFWLKDDFSTTILVTTLCLMIIFLSIAYQLK